MKPAASSPALSAHPFSGGGAHTETSASFPFGVSPPTAIAWFRTTSSAAVAAMLYQVDVQKTEIVLWVIGLISLYGVQLGFEVNPVESFRRGAMWQILLK